MAPSGFFIDRNEFEKWPESLRNQVIAQILGGEAEVQVEGTRRIPDTAASSDDITDDEHFAELSPSQAREFIAGCGAKTKAAVTAMAHSDSRFFNLKDVAAALGVSVVELPGVWAGLTRRIRTVTGDPDAYLIYWHGDGIFDDAENYMDHRGELTESTYAALRKALAIT